MVVLCYRNRIKNNAWIVHLAVISSCIHKLVLSFYPKSMHLLQIKIRGKCNEFWVIIKILLHKVSLFHPKFLQHADTWKWQRNSLKECTLEITVKPVYNGQRREYRNMAVLHRWPLYRGLANMEALGSWHKSQRIWFFINMFCLILTS